MVHYVKEEHFIWKSKSTERGITWRTKNHEINLFFHKVSDDEKKNHDKQTNIIKRNIFKNKKNKMIKEHLSNKICKHSFIFYFLLLFLFFIFKSVNESEGFREKRKIKLVSKI
jgi:hypothetical protein